MYSFLAVLLVLAVNAQQPPPGLPEVLQICQKTFKNPYGCGGASYNNSALFLSSQSQQENAPELLYYGGCGSVPNFNLETGGFDEGLYAGLGKCQLTDLSFDYAWVRQQKLSARIGSVVNPVVGECYFIWTIHSDVQAMWAFRLDSLVQNGPAKVSYTVFWYQYVLTSSSIFAPNYSEHPKNVCNA